MRNIARCYIAIAQVNAVVLLFCAMGMRMYMLTIKNRCIEGQEYIN